MIFSAEEDFGIIPVEAQACGRPVIAFGKGGSLETVVDGVTGVFFDKQEQDAVIAALNKFEELDSKNQFDQQKIVEHAKSFSTQRFCNQLKDKINEVLKDFSK